MQSKTALLFPGHGSPYPNMGRACYSSYSVFRETIWEANETLRSLLGSSYEELVFADGNDEHITQNLLRTEFVQPLLLVASVAYHRVLTGVLGEFGKKADVLVGHSVGEFAASVAGGLISFEDAICAMFERGRIFRQLQLSNQDTGTMAALHAGWSDVVRCVEKAGTYVSIAAINSPTQTVVAGLKNEVESLLGFARRGGIRGQILPVEVAWHTPLAARWGESLFKAFLQTLDFKRPHLPILNNVDFTYYDSELSTQHQVAENFAKQLGQPMNFVECVEHLYQDGVRTFIEVGPKRILSSFVKSILHSRPHQIAAVDPRNNAGKEGIEGVLSLS